MTPPGPDKWLPDARTRTFLRQYALAPRQIVDAGLRGQHQSFQRGDGLEFSQYRAYLPGDDLRRVDWRVYGRSDRLFVREADQESRLAVWILVDSTGSMAEADADGVAKFDYARRLAAALAWLAAGQNDDIALIGLRQPDLYFLPPRRVRRPLERFLHGLDELEPRGAWPDRRQIDPLLDRIPHRALLILIGDLFETDDEVTRSLRHLVAAGRQLISVQLLTRQELEFPHRGRIEVVDRESGVRRRVHATRYRQTYLDNLRTELARIESEQRDIGARFVRVCTDRPLTDALNGCLAGGPHASTADLTEPAA